MSFGAPSGSGKQAAPRPPEKGSFPLDHDGECTQPMQIYLECMKKARNDNSLCREESKNYLECRMSRYDATSELGDKTLIVGD